MKNCTHTVIDLKCGWCKAEWYKGEKEDVRQALIKMRDVIADLYAQRGEDETTKKLCRKALGIAGAWT